MELAYSAGEVGVFGRPLRKGDFFSLGDQAVTALINHQDAVLRADPGGGFAVAVVVKVKACMALAKATELHAVAIEVYDDGGAAIVVAIVAIAKSAAHGGGGAGVWGGSAVVICSAPIGITDR